MAVWCDYLTRLYAVALATERNKFNAFELLKILLKIQLVVRLALICLWHLPLLSYTVCVLVHFVPEH